MFVSQQCPRKSTHHFPLLVDHLVLTGNPPGLIQAVAPTFPANGFLAEGAMEPTYHAFLSLGADSPANGGNGAVVDVLLDTGASDSWVTWSGCSDCSEQSF